MPNPRNAHPAVTTVDDDRRGGRATAIEREGAAAHSKDAAADPTIAAPDRRAMRKPHPPRACASLSQMPQAVHLIGKEIHQVARVYPLYDVAKILLAETWPLPRRLRGPRAPRAVVAWQAR